MYSACTASHLCTQTHTQTYILHAQPLTHTRGHTHIYKHMFCMHRMCTWTHTHILASSFLVLKNTLVVFRKLSRSGVYSGMLTGTRLWIRSEEFTLLVDLTFI